LHKNYIGRQLQPDLIRARAQDSLRQTFQARAQAFTATPVLPVASLTTPAGQKKRLVNINSDSVAELDRLPRIGPGLARRIIEYRQKNGNFTEKKQILKVQGIGPKIYQEIESIITIN
jgi:competence ComEA-like helix-hairpin-helix protein